MASAPETTPAERLIDRIDNATADYGVRRDAAAMLRNLVAERDDLRRLLVGLGAGIPASAVLKGEDRADV